MYEMYKNLAEINNALTALGCATLPADEFWTSSSSDTNNAEGANAECACRIRLSDGEEKNLDKTSEYYVCAIRQFN